MLQKLQKQSDQPVIGSWVVYWQMMRLRTLPLALASIFCGNALAYLALGDFAYRHWAIFFLTLWVALSLQILSNFANDYGDGVRGTDRYRDESSPKRLTGAGQVALPLMRWVIGVWALQTFLSGVGLIGCVFFYFADRALWGAFWVFLALGVGAILAAMAYTMGRRPYGYRALGEGAVFLFFGWLGVLGSAYLQTYALALADFWVASACGFLAAAVLYLNNMRDLVGDRQAGKITLAVLLGRQAMGWLYFVWVILGFLGYFAAFWYYFGGVIAGGSLVLMGGLFCRHLRFMWVNRLSPKLLGTQLKSAILMALGWSVCFVCLTILRAFGGI